MFIDQRKDHQNLEYIAAICFKGANVLKGPALLLLLVAFLTPEQQGIWFFITNLGAIAYMADFGLAVLTMQAIANSRPPDAPAMGNQNYQLELIKSSYRFLSWSVAIVILSIFPVGLYLMSPVDDIFWWAWAIYLLSAVPVHFFLLDMHILQGFGGVLRSFVIRLAYVTSSFLMCATLVVCGWSVLSVGVANMVVSTSLYLWGTSSKQYSIWQLTGGSNQLPQSGSTPAVRRRYIASWVSGYLMFFLIVPIITKSQGAVSAGQIGMTLAMVKAASALALAPLESKLSVLGTLFSEKRNTELNSLYQKTCNLGHLLFFCIATVIVLVTWSAESTVLFSGRVAPIGILIPLLIAEFFYVKMSLIAKFVRIFLVEPFAFANACIAMLVVIICSLMSSYYSLQTWVIAHLFIYAGLGFPAFYYIYRRNVKKFLC